MVNHRETGTRFEKIAGSYLESKGYKILQYNFYCRRGEIDIVAKDRETIVFVEVKFRSQLDGGHPLEAVTRKKQRMICKTALYYLSQHGLMDHDCRFDVVGIAGEEIVLVQNAFPYLG